MFVLVCACVHAVGSAEYAVDRRLTDAGTSTPEPGQVTRTLAPADCGPLSRAVFEPISCRGWATAVLQAIPGLLLFMQTFSV